MYVPTQSMPSLSMNRALTHLFMISEIVRMTREDLGIDPEKSGLNGSATRVVRTERPIMTRKTTWIDGTAAEQAERLKKKLQEGGLIC